MYCLVFGKWIRKWYKTWLEYFGTEPVSRSPAQWTCPDDAEDDAFLATIPEPPMDASKQV